MIKSTMFETEYFKKLKSIYNIHKIILKDNVEKQFRKQKNLI